MPRAPQALKRLTNYGVKFRSYEEAYIDTTHEFGDLLGAFAAKLAQLERQRIRARVMAGLEKARADGRTYYFANRSFFIWSTMR